MKLMYLLTEPFGVGGVQSDMLALSKDLVKEGDVVYVASTPGVMLDELKSRGAKFVNLDFQFKGLFGMLKVGFELRKFIKQEGIEVLAPQSVRSTIASFICLRLIPFFYKVEKTNKKIAIITTIHNIHNPMHFKYGGIILNICSDYVIFESHYERNRLIASGLKATKSSVIHSGIDTDKFLPMEPSAELLQEYGLDKSIHAIFGIVARLSEEKGHQYLLQAFSKVYKENNAARLLVVGDGPLLEETKEIASKLDLNDSVIFTGLKRNVAEHLSIFDVFVLSSTRESFPLAAREAMAAGKAVIAPRIGGCPEVVDENNTGYLFEAANVDNLAGCMNKIMVDDTFKQFGLNSRQRVEDLFSRKQWVSGDKAIYLNYL
ncbi:MAG: glycosyltransferase [Thiohalomonadales bacterium]